MCLPELVGFTKCENDVFEFGHEIFGCVVHELQSTLVVWFSERMLLREAVSRDELARFKSPDHAPMKRVPVYTADQKTALEERVWEFKLADVGIL